MKGYQCVMKKLKQGPVYLLTILTGPYAGEKMAIQDETMTYSHDGLKEFWTLAKAKILLQDCPQRREINGFTVFAERMVHEPELVLCGAGHISQELAGLAEYLGYPYTVIDEREEFANYSRFPNAKECICEPFSQALSEREFSSNAYFVIVTRGHIYDLLCLESILNMPRGYVGMIGSRGKVKKTMEALREKGVPEQALEQVYAPIGLPIGGQTPREIALSIVAQLVQVKNQSCPASYLEPEMRERLEQNVDGVLVKIVGKRGSAPRGVGSQMIVNENGIVCGTIGGGVIEYQAVKRAKTLVKNGNCMVESYCLDSDSAASLGMWCGGEVDVFFET